MKTDLKELFEGYELSEDFITKAETIFEAKLHEKVQSLEEEFAVKENELKENYEALSERYIQEVVLEDFSEKLDNYVDYVVENWMKDNALAIENGVKVEMAENFINGLQNLFTENYVSIPEDKNDIVGELEVRLQEMNEKFNNILEENVDLKNQHKDFLKNQIIQEEIKDLTESEKEKVLNLAESIDYKNEADFKIRINTIKEKFLIVESTEIQEDTEMITEENVEAKPLDPQMAYYVNALNKFNNKK